MKRGVVLIILIIALVLLILGILQIVVKKSNSVIITKEQFIERMKGYSSNLETEIVLTNTEFIMPLTCDYNIHNGKLRYTYNISCRSENNEFISLANSPIQIERFEEIINSFSENKEGNIIVERTTNTMWEFVPPPDPYPSATQGTIDISNYLIDEGDISNCEQIVEEPKRTICHVKKAIVNDDETLCDNIKNFEVQEKGKIGYMGHYNNFSFVWTLNPQRCKSMVQGEEFICEFAAQGFCIYDAFFN